MVDAAECTRLAWTYEAKAHAIDDSQLRLAFLRLAVSLRALASRTNAIGDQTGK